MSALRLPSSVATKKSTNPLLAGLVIGVNHCLRMRERASAADRKKLDALCKENDAIQARNPTSIDDAESLDLLDRLTAWGASQRA